MKQAFKSLKYWTLRTTFVAILLSMSTSNLTQAATVTYILDDVWLLPDISHPGSPAQPMTGSFEWTYEVGDFENGSGQFIYVTFPWYDPGMKNLGITVDLTSIEFTLVGKYHDLGLDVTLFLVEPLSPNQPSTIDTVRSAFEIENGIVHRGHVISGSIVPNLTVCTEDLDNNGSVGTSDLLILFAQWGTDGSADFDGSGAVGTSDLLILFANWGSCP